MATGKVKWWSDPKGYGFITSDDDGDIFVHYSALQMPGHRSLKEGQHVTFDKVQGPKGTQAAEVKILPSSDHITALPSTEVKMGGYSQKKTTHKIHKTHEADSKMESEEIEELDTEGVDQKLLREISGWKREAKAEDNYRYFWHVSEVDQIARGEKYFVIGRKGSGKTAISEYFNQQQKHDVFAEKLSFKSFPFNELYSQRNPKYTPPNQFITLWKYLIYNTVCRLMLKNEAVDSTIRDQLSQLYGDDVSLNRRVGKWVGKEFSISLFGIFGIKIANQMFPQAQQNWIEQVNFLEDLILKYAGNSKYYILFDELDEDYRDIIKNEEQNEQYSALITSLFKAVQDVRTLFAQNNFPKIFPIIFLRDDIYEIVRDADKNKWGDFKVDLSWDEDKIKKLVAFRISRAINSECSDSLPFLDAWSLMFGKQRIRVGSGGGRIPTFDFIARSTLLRPRDFVAYLQNCATHAIEDGKKITPSVIKRVDKAFSNYLKDELVDELGAILPDISNIFNAISQLRKWNFKVQEIETAYAEQVAMGFIKEKNVKYVLQNLFLFSVIGNTPRVGIYFFRYKNREARLNFNERVVVHRGLFKALQII